MDQLASFNPAWLSFAVAVLALVLSQLLPLRMIAKGRKATLTLPNQFNLSHALGQLQMNVDVFIQNTGGTDVLIKRINCVVIDKSKATAFVELPGQTYYSREGPRDPNQPWTEYTIGAIPLKPGDQWAERVHFYCIPTFEDEETLLAIVSDIRGDIRAKLALRPSNAPGPVEADPNLIRRAHDYFNQTFWMHKGDYTLLIVLSDVEDRILAIERRDFLLFESHIKTLKQILDNYKYGWGIYIPPSGELAPIVWPRLQQVNVSADELRRTYARYANP